MLDIQSISKGLKLEQDGIWYASDAEKLSYPTEGNEACFSVEDNSFWFKHRNNCIASVIRSFPPTNNDTIFDIGGGNGYVSLGLTRAGFNMALVEPGAIGAYNAKKRGLKNVICATSNTAKFEQQSLPAVGLFDVIEHIEDDIGFLESIKDLVKPGGYLYLTVPSYSFLWSEEDVNAGHFRRYSLRSIAEILKSVGFHVEFSSYIFRFLPLPIFLLRTLPFKMGISIGKDKTNNIARDHAVSAGVGGNILDSILKAEVVKLDMKRPMSFGGSCLVVAKKS